jgi:hypothetical protein
VSLKSKISNRLRVFTLDKKPNIYRPSSKPFMSGDSLRKMADFIFDETQSLNPKKVKENDIIFLNTGLKELFFELYHPLINNKYILITHNHDDSINKADFKFLDEKIVHWFAAKLDAEPNEKISPIAYGLENKRYLKNGLKRNFKRLSISAVNNTEKSNQVLCSFSVHSNPLIREPLLKIAENRKDLITIKNFQKSKPYLEELSTYLYNLCPEGNNFESHRIWESLIFRTTPIVIKNLVNTNFYNLGVPLIMLDRWEDLNSITKQDLELLNKVNKNKDYEKFSELKYWTSTINEKK